MRGHLQAEVLVIGGGPVGLVLAHALGARGARTWVVEQRPRAPELSMAIGITPPSLEILRGLGLEAEFLRRGVKIRQAWVHENRVCLGALEFGNTPAPFPFILSLPQGDTVHILETALASRPTVSLRRGVECLGLELRAHGVEVRLRENGEEFVAQAGWVIGCDGHRSIVREALEISVKQRRYPARFIMADFMDRTGWGPDARVFFGRQGAVESFPLPGGMRRWIAQVSKECAPGAVDLVQLVKERVGNDLEGLQITPLTSFQPRRMEATHFFKGRGVLCGDAAHVMSPIGGQGMNVGLADAASLAGHWTAEGLNEASLPGWEQERRRGFRFVASGASLGMWIGTRTGSQFSAGRRWLIGRVLFHQRIKPKLAGWFMTGAGAGPRPRGLEQMDRADCCPERLLRTVDQFASINRLFSRYRTIFGRWLFSKMERGGAGKIHLVDLGAGGCDISVWALSEARRRGIPLRITAVDSDPRIVRHAQERHGQVKGLTVRQLDAREIGGLGRIDYLFANHFLHHLDERAAADVLRVIGKVVARGTVISDLKRSWISQAGYALMAACFYRRSFALGDGLLSIRKGFVESELMSLAREAELADRARVERLAPGRLILRIEGCEEKKRSSPAPGLLGAPIASAR